MSSESRTDSRPPGLSSKRKTSVLLLGYAVYASLRLLLDLLAR